MIIKPPKNRRALIFALIGGIIGLLISLLLLNLFY